MKYSNKVEECTSAFFKAGEYTFLKSVYKNSINFFVIIIAISFCLIKVSAYELSDITYWAGEDSGPGVNEAALVIDWNDGSSPVMWGYRWNSTETKTGEDMLRAVVAADTQLTADLPSFGFGPYVNQLTYTGGTVRDASDTYFTDGKYWQYWVNSPQTPFVYDSTTHGLPNGNPYSLGSWEFSNTGISDRPLFDGSFDIHSYKDDFSSPDDFPIMAVPELSSFTLILFSVIILLLRRNRYCD